MSNTKRTQDRVKLVGLDPEVHRAAKVVASRKGLQIREFCNDGITRHIIKNLTASDCESPDFESLVRKQKRRSNRGVRS